MFRIALVASVSLLVGSASSASDIDGTKFATGWVSALPMATGMCNYTNLNDEDVNVEVTGVGGDSTLGQQTFYDVAPHESVSIAFTVPAYPVPNRSFLCKFEAELVANGGDPVAACNATAKRPNGEQHGESDCQRLTAASSAPKQTIELYYLTQRTVLEDGVTVSVASCKEGDFATGGGFDLQFARTTKVLRSQWFQEPPPAQPLGSGWVVWYEGPVGHAVFTKVVCAKHSTKVH